MSHSNYSFEELGAVVSPRLGLESAVADFEFHQDDYTASLLDLDPSNVTCQEAAIEQPHTLLAIYLNRRRNDFAVVQASLNPDFVQMRLKLAARRLLEPLLPAPSFAIDAQSALARIRDEGIIMLAGVIFAERSSFGENEPIFYSSRAFERIGDLVYHTNPEHAKASDSLPLTEKAVSIAASVSCALINRAIND
ncbi:MAG: hypothetical protein ABIV43_00490 [Candidatus Saccharimonadales bacterium]